VSSGQDSSLLCTWNRVQGADPTLSLCDIPPVSFAVFPAWGSGQRATFGRNPYLYVEDRERHDVLKRFKGASLYKVGRDSFRFYKMRDLSLCPLRDADIPTTILECGSDTPSIKIIGWQGAVKREDSRVPEKSLGLLSFEPFNRRLQQIVNLRLHEARR
jgi:hypothetical protein